MVSTRTAGRDAGQTLSRRRGWLLIAPAAAIILVLFIAPIVYFLRFSFEMPSATLFSIPTFTLENFIRFFTDPRYLTILLRTLVIAVCSTFAALLLALPVALLITKSSTRVRGLLIMGTVFPLLVGNVISSIGWVALLGYSGLVNTLLIRVGIIDSPADLLHSPLTVGIAISSIVVPIMVLILQASLASVDPATEQAALSLGARPARAFRQVTLPQIVPGIIAGTSLVFVLCLNAYATPLLVGGSQVPMLAPSIYRVITTSNNWPFGAAMAAILLLLCLTVTILYGWLVRRLFEKWRKETR